jgi:hypothetical protein
MRWRGVRGLAALLLLTALAWGQAAKPAQSPAQANAARAREVLDQMIAELGGPAYMNLVDIKQDGRSYSFHNGQPTGPGILFWRFLRYPDKERIELTKQRDVAYVYNGDHAYEVTFKGTATMDAKTTAEYLRRRQHALDWVLRHWLNEPGVALFYDGTAVAEQKPADQVTILNAQNDSVTLYIDSTTHLPIKKTYSWRDPVDREKDTEDEVFDAYRKIQGIMTPFSVTRFYNGEMASQRFVATVSYNQNLADSLFAATTTYDPKQLPGKK